MLKKMLTLALIVTPLLANAAIKDDDWYNSGRLDIDYEKGNSNVEQQSITSVEGQWRIGDDFNKLVIELEGQYRGERNSEQWQDAEIQLLYSRYLAKYWDWRAGIRQGLGSNSDTALVLGVAGLAPYWFETQASLYLDQNGNWSAQTEFSYELQLSQKLVADLFINTSWNGSDQLDDVQASGLVTNEIGLGLRYEFNRNFALYLEGYQNKYHGNTALLRQINGLDTEEQGLRVGIRLFNIIF